MPTYRFVNMHSFETCINLLSCKSKTFTITSQIGLTMHCNNGEKHKTITLCCNHVHTWHIVLVNLIYLNY